jgi:hypothetical protein
MLTLTPNMKVAPAPTSKPVKLLPVVALADVETLTGSEEEGFEPPELLVSEMRELLIVTLRY